MSAWCWVDGTRVLDGESGQECPACDEPMAPIPNPERCDVCGRDWPSHKTGNGRCHLCTLTHGRKLVVKCNMNFEVSTAGVSAINSRMRREDWEDE